MIFQFLPGPVAVRDATSLLLGFLVYLLIDFNGRNRCSLRASEQASARVRVAYQVSSHEVPAKIQKYRNAKKTR